MRSSVAPAPKSMPWFSVGRMTSESIATLRRFHSSGRMPGAGGSRSGRRVGRVIGAPPRPAPSVDRRLRRIGMVRGQRAAQEGSHRAQRLASRHPPSRIERDAIHRQVAVLEREEDAGASRRRVLHAEEHTSVAGRRTLEPREEVQVLVGAVEDEPAPTRPRLPRHLALVGRPGAVADDRPLAQSAAAEDRVRLEVAGRPLRVHQRREERRAEHDCRANVSLHAFRPVRGRPAPLKVRRAIEPSYPMETAGSIGPGPRANRSGQSIIMRQLANQVNVPAALQPPAARP